jgi:hypothetical protein
VLLETSAKRAPIRVHDMAELRKLNRFTPLPPGWGCRECPDPCGDGCWNCGPFPSSAIITFSSPICPSLDGAHEVPRIPFGVTASYCNAPFRQGGCVLGGEITSNTEECGRLWLEVYLTQNSAVVLLHTLTTIRYNGSVLWEPACDPTAMMPLVADSSAFGALGWCTIDYPFGYYNPACACNTTNMAGWITIVT